MRHTMQIEPMFTATQSSPASDSLALSALQTTRDAIARWSGKTLAAAATLPRDTSRVSPQARWLAETRRGLAAFIEHGGFSQFDGAGAPLPAQLNPSMYCLDSSKPGMNTENANACMD